MSKQANLQLGQCTQQSCLLMMWAGLEIKQKLITQKVRGLYTDEGSIGLAIFKNV